MSEFNNIIKVVGQIRLGNRAIDVYRSMDDPLFRVYDIGRLLEYSGSNDWKLIGVCEEDEKLQLPMVVSGQRRAMNFVTETGLYNILEQSRMPKARQWRRLVNDELIAMRKEKGRDIGEQFEHWDSMLDTVYFDPDTGVMMQSVTVQGGDVIQIPYEEDKE